MLANGLVMFRDFVACIATTYGACDGSQSAAVAATYLASYQTADQGANADAERTVWGDRSRLLIGRFWSGIPGLLSFERM